MKAKNKIDVHHHIFPKEYVEALRKVGINKSLGVDFPDWSPEKTLSIMDKNGIRKALVSITAPGVYFPGADLSDSFSEQLARITNGAIAKLIDQHPVRFGGFATIPLLNTQSAIKELDYSLDDLKFQGVCLMTNYQGKYLGDSAFEDFFKELDNRKAVVFVHPTGPGADLDTSLDLPHGLIEAPFDTTRAVANLMYNGVFDRYPNIKYILAHGGGTIPFLAWRLSMIEYGQRGKKSPVLRTLYDFLFKGRPEKGLRILRNLYYDTALVSGEYAIKTLQSFAGARNILFGSDLSIAKVAGIVLNNLSKDGEFTEEEYNDMANGNCMRLFPGLRAG